MQTNQRAAPVLYSDVNPSEMKCQASHLPVLLSVGVDRYPVCDRG